MIAEKEKIKEYIGLSIDKMIEFQTLLSSIPAISPDSGGKGEFKKAQALEKWLNKQGFSNIKQYNAPDERAEGGIRPNLVLEIPGKSHDRTFWIMSHIDVVPPGELSLWETDPYTVVRKGDVIYGRGVEDNQQGLTASVFATLSLIKNNIIPMYDVKLLFVADEEMGSKYGIDYLLNNHNLFKKNDLVLVPDGGDPSSTKIEVAEKNILWLKVTVTGKQCHASTPEVGINAFAAAAAMICKLPEIEKEVGDYNPIFAPPTTTITPTKKESNVPNINTIPGEDVFYIDCRILPETGADVVFEKIKKMAKDIETEKGVTIKFEIVQKAVSKATPESSPLVSMIKAAIKEVYKKDSKVTGMGGGTVAAYLRNKDIDAVVWSTIEETAHMPNEKCSLKNLESDAIVMAYLMAGCI